MRCPRAAGRTGRRVLSLPEDVPEVQEVARGGLPATSQLCCVQKSRSELCLLPLHSCCDILTSSQVVCRERPIKKPRTNLSK